MERVLKLFPGHFADTLNIWDVQRAVSGGGGACVWLQYSNECRYKRQRFSTDLQYKDVFNVVMHSEAFVGRRRVVQVGVDIEAGHKGHR